MSSPARVIILASFLVLSIASTMRASCGSASCPLSNNRALRAGSLSLSYVREYIDQDRIHVGSTLSFVGAIPYEHDEVRTVNQREAFRLSVGLTDRVGLGADLAFAHIQHSHIHHEAGEDVLESWDFSGVGDLRLSARFLLLRPDDWDGTELSLFAGVKLPTGVTDFANAEGERAELSLQPGTGSTDGFAGVQFRRAIASVPMLSGEYSALPLIAEVDAQWNGRGPDDWQFGPSVVAHLGTSYKWSARASFLFQANAKFLDYASVGTSGEPRENTGGTWVFLSPGMELQLDAGISAFGYVQLPVYQNVHGIQQTSRFNLQFGVTAEIGVTD